LLERQKHTLLVSLLDARTSVMHLNQQRQLAGCVFDNRNMHLDLTLLCELEGVGDEVEQNLSDSSGIRLDNEGHVGFKLGDKFDARFR